MSNTESPERRVANQAIVDGLDSYSSCNDGHPLEGPICIDCGTATWCGQAHGSGHDHSVTAVKCTRRTRIADGTCPDCLGPLVAQAFLVNTDYCRCTRCGHVFTREVRS